MRWWLFAIDVATQPSDQGKAWGLMGSTHDIG